MWRVCWGMWWILHSRVVLSDIVDWCICFTRKIQHGGDWERSRPQGLKNVQNFLLNVRPLSWACGHGTEMLLILKELFSTWLFPEKFGYDSPKKCPTILYAVNLWLNTKAIYYMDGLHLDISLTNSDNPTNTGQWSSPNVGLMLGQHRRRWPNLLNVFNQPLQRWNICV